MLVAPARKAMPASTLRRAQTLQEIARFASDLCRWRKHREADDPRGQHQTQLQAISTEVGAALDDIRTRAANVGAAGGSAGEIYESLARLDRQLIWARYAWDFFRARFDQRDDERLRKALKAADEASWSCFKPPFEAANGKRPPAPLACIELDYTPSTLLSSHAHTISRLKGADAGPLAKFFETLPVPLLRLPPSVITSPWTLAVVAHEIGHAVFKHIADTGITPDLFADRLEQTARDAGGAEQDGQRWRPWATELFADWYALLMVGPAAIWSLAQLDFGAAATMASPRGPYPPAEIRLLLLVRMAQELGLKAADSMLQPFGISAQQLQTLADTRDGKIAARVARLVNEGDGKKLAQAAGYRVSDFLPVPLASSPVETWADVLRGRIDRPIENELRTARLVTAGAVHAALQIEQEIAKAEQQQQSKHPVAPAKPDALALLCDATLDRVEKSAETGKRGAVSAAPEPAHDLLVHILKDAPDDELFAIPGPTDPDEQP